MEEERERIYNRLLARMKKQADDEDLRIAREIAETEEERERVLKEKEEKNKADLKLMAEHRMNVVRKKYHQVSEFCCYLIIDNRLLLS